MIILLLFLYMNRSFIPLFFLLVISLYGFVPLIEGGGLGDILGFVYGLRDIFLLTMIVELCRYRGGLGVEKQEVLIFVYFVIAVSLFDGVTTNLLGVNIADALLKTSEYYSNKGVDINLSNGFMGDRIGAPLYSPNLLCTLLACCVFFDKRIAELPKFMKLLSFFSIIFTMSKVFIFSILFYFMKSRWKLLVVIGLCSLFPFYMLLDIYYSNLPPSFLKYHLASILGHLHAFSMALENGFLSFVPEPLGSHSIAMQVVNSGVDSGAGIESTVLARLSELKIYYIIVLVYLAYSLSKIGCELGQKFVVFFFFLSLLTATSNQPVAFIPALYLLKAIYR